MENKTMLYDNGVESFIISFDSYPDKYEQLKVCKARGIVIEVIISVGKDVRRILSSDLKFQN